MKARKSTIIKETKRQLKQLPDSLNHIKEIYIYINKGYGVNVCWKLKDKYLDVECPTIYPNQPKGKIRHIIYVLREALEGTDISNIKEIEMYLRTNSINYGIKMRTSIPVRQCR